MTAFKNFICIILFSSLLFGACSSEDCRVCIEIITMNTCTNNQTNNDQAVISQDPLGEMCDIDFRAFESTNTETEVKGNCTLTTITTIVCQ